MYAYEEDMAECFINCVVFSFSCTAIAHVAVRVGFVLFL